jgi:hypothetical protein
MSDGIFNAREVFHAGSNVGYRGWLGDQRLVVKHRLQPEHISIEFSPWNKLKFFKGGENAVRCSLSPS